MTLVVMPVELPRQLSHDEKDYTMNAFKKTMKTAPSTARIFDNGDVSIKREEYVKGEPMFGYYKKTKSGYSLEKLCFTGRSATSYNWQKVNNPDFVASKAFEKAKAKSKAPAKTPVLKRA